MQLSASQLQSAAWGAVSVREEEGCIAFHRFTKVQEDFYAQRDPDFYKKCFATSGVRLVFKTDSPTLTMNVPLSPATSRKYASVDIFTDGRPIGSMDNLSDVDMAPDYTEKELPLDTLCGKFCLGDGEKTVTVYLPWSVRTVIRSLELENGASFTPVRREKKLLVFGDSISQGYDALRPSHTYTTQLADYLHAEEYNKAIGGETFVPELASLREDFDPDYISVAYGTNDWGHGTFDEFVSGSTAFYKTVSTLYPNARIIILVPIWRKDYEEVRSCCPFRQLPELIREAVKGLPNVTVVDCFGFVPHDERFFADLRLHPNDAGFDHYFNNLLEKLRQEGNL